MKLQRTKKKRASRQQPYNLMAEAQPVVAKEFNSNFHHDECHCNQSTIPAWVDQSVRTALKAHCNSSIHGFHQSLFPIVIVVVVESWSLS
jgi:hypothetical protein